MVYWGYVYSGGNTTFVLVQDKCTETKSKITSYCQSPQTVVSLNWFKNKGRAGEKYQTGMLKSSNRL